MLLLYHIRYDLCLSPKWWFPLKENHSFFCPKKEQSTREKSRRACIQKTPGGSSKYSASYYIALLTILRNHAKGSLTW